MLADQKYTFSMRGSDILFFRGRSSFQKLKDSFRRFFMVSLNNPGSKKYLRSRNSMLYEKRRHLRNFTAIIHPFSKFRYYWNIWMILIMANLILLVPYHAAFGIVHEKEVLRSIKMSLLAICYLDIILNFFTGYFDREQSTVELNQRKLIAHYVKHGTFFCDLIGSFPTDVIFLIAWQDFKVAREIASLLCIFRVFSLSKYVNELVDMYNVSVTTYNLFMIAFWLLVLLHWQSCIFWLVPIATTTLRQPQYPASDSWIIAQGLWDKSELEQYLFSLLMALAVSFRSTLLKDDLRNIPDLYVIMGVQITGTAAVWYVTAMSMRFMKAEYYSKLRFESSVAQLEQYMKHKQLPLHSQCRIKGYYEFRFQRRYFRESAILNTISLQMRQEIGMHSCRKLVENVAFFNNLPLSLLSRIVSLLKSEVFLTNDVIVRANQPGDCMYFIGSGTVAVYTESGKEVCHLQDGAYFGEIALVMADERRVASVVAVEICELYRLDRLDFARTIYPYPLLWDRIKKIAIERHEKTMIMSNN